MHYSVLLTCVNGELVEFVAKDLKQKLKNLVIIGVDAQTIKAPPWLDFFYSVPRGSHPEYLPRILDIVKQHGINLIIPWSDEEAENLSLHKASLHSLGCDVAAADPQTLGIIMDKEKTYRFLKENGIKVPYFEPVTNIEELHAAIEHMRCRGNDFVIKPAMTRGGRDVYIVNLIEKKPFITTRNRQTACDLATFNKIYLPRMDWGGKCVVMERMMPPAYDVDILSWQGKTISVIPRKRFNPDGLPYHGYTMEKNDVLIQIAQKAAAVLNINGLYDIDFMCDAQGAYCVMEVNPRPSGSLAYTHRSGIPIMAALIDMHRTSSTLFPCRLDETLSMDHEALLKAQRV